MRTRNLLCGLVGGLAVVVSSPSLAELAPFDEQARIFASDGVGVDQYGFPDRYGHVVRIDGEWAAVGDPYHNGIRNRNRTPPKVDDAGAVYLLKRQDDGRWAEHSLLLGGWQSDHFGRDLAISGTTLLVAAPDDDTLQNGDNCGSVELFVLDESGTWVSAAKLLDSQGGRRQRFGKAVSIRGDTAAVSAYYSRDVVVFVRSDSGWVEHQRLSPSDIKRDDNFGAAIAIDGNTMIIGAPGDDDLGDYSGSAYVFEREGELWVEKQKLYPSDATAATGFAYRIDLAGDLALFAAEGGAFNQYHEQEGAAYIFSRGVNGWSEEAKLEASDGGPGNEFGSDVAIDGYTVVIGASVAKKAYVFEHLQSGQWHELQALAPQVAAFGYSLDLDGNDLLVASLGRAWHNDASPGAVFHYQRDTADRMQVAIDIKPGYVGNRLNLSTQRRFWVAILSDAGFDALQVDPSTVRLGSGRASPNRYSANDVNADGLPDLMVRFQTEEVGIACGATELTLTGETYAAERIVGTDKIKTTGC